MLTAGSKHFAFLRLLDYVFGLFVQFFNLKGYFFSFYSEYVRYLKKIIYKKKKIFLSREEGTYFTQGKQKCVKMQAMLCYVGRA